MIDANESNFYIRKTLSTVDGEFSKRWVLQSESFTSGEGNIRWLSIRSVSVRWV